MGPKEESSRGAHLTLRIHLDLRLEQIIQFVKLLLALGQSGSTWSLQDGAAQSKVAEALA